ncbi:N-glycosylase/DNA lyase [Candidatus Pacearchaeota archaeon]|nr:N-glycosylase/DNA lyase [Candidatus Pacearchaeota archaeon]
MNPQELLSLYQIQKPKIQKRLNEFKSLDEKYYFPEFLFCLLTPQSQAKKCWQAVEELSMLKKFTKKNVSEILKSKTRFYKTKTDYILNAPYLWHKELKGKMRKDDPQWSRKWIVESVKGIGMKEASHFLRNIGFSNNQIAILDRHILKNLKEAGLIEETKIKSEKNYLEIEKIYLDYANSLSIPPDELDLLWWSKENGEIFK